MDLLKQLKGWVIDLQTHNYIYVLFVFLIFSTACQKKKNEVMVLPVTSKVELKDTIETDTIKEQIEVVRVPEVLPEKGYFYVVASFDNQADALRYVEKLNVADFPAAKVVTRNHGINEEVFRVVVKCYQTRRGAVENLGKFRDSTGIKDTWILIKRF